MKLADLELSAYDLTAIFLPGALAMAEIGVSAYGVATVWRWLGHLSTGGWVVLAALSFASGQVVSQAGFETAKLFDDRFHKRTRDKIWSQNASDICSVIKERSALSIEPEAPHACDRAFNVCLSLSQGRFEKRNVFSAVAALSLSLWFLSMTGFIPIGLRALTLRTSSAGSNWSLGWVAPFVAVAAGLSWRRSQLYFHLADISVFDIARCEVLSGDDNAESGRPNTEE